MELFQELVKEANQAFKTADHLTYVTYPLVNDIKLITTILEDLNKALILGVEALLQYEFLYKRISAVPKNFKDKFEVFKDSCAQKYNFSRDFLVLINDINNIVEHRRNSPVEFIRSNKVVMCTSDYKMRVLNLEKVKHFDLQAKAFISKLNSILVNDRRV